MGKEIGNHLKFLVNVGPEFPDAFPLGRKRFPAVKRGSSCDLTSQSDPP
ncbi:hypothetical protein ACNKHU_25865 [Shigella flexneri]